MISRFVISLVSAIISLLTAAYFVPGFLLEKTPQSLLLVALIFTLMNVTIRPFLRLFFGPIVIVTLGLFYIVINAVILNILDIVSEGVTISGLTSLVYATVIVTVINFLINFSFRRVERERDE
ncbi:MAG: hypothetical protein A3A04_00855 [Candidatus Harrisonbacteria bacterium RIFCSPLOWO2_01_FULL_40_28]|uniref:Phage holin family protein n=1 Tax=Candidatus Harrisonbacteria bacterium RIFCSPLOWO2_01_FULL_40_28 TaxID=1798406 RepID=A0A1G1ZNC4_9BACT|nr:MAG: hypothetical protein A3A04_00855 [Candidatus Harrisonbacteria bacterium RIFCSPLOWO2_01_FULL_40_28]